MDIEQITEWLNDHGLMRTERKPDGVFLNTWFSKHGGMILYGQADIPAGTIVIIFEKVKTKLYEECRARSL